MKIKTLALLAAPALVAALFAFSVPHTNKVKVNTSQSTLNWKASKVTGDSHSGTIGIKSGELTMDHGKLVGGKFIIDMSTIAVTDLQGEWKGKLEGHLHSEDFFDVAKHPTAEFSIVKAQPMTPDADGNTHKISGNLTIKGVSEPITFPAKVTISGETVRATAKIEVDRTKYGIKYNSASFFPDLGDMVINDNFDLNLNLAAGM